MPQAHFQGHRFPVTVRRRGAPEAGGSGGGVGRRGAVRGGVLDASLHRAFLAREGTGACRPLYGDRIGGRPRPHRTRPTTKPASVLPTPRTPMSSATFSSVLFARVAQVCGFVEFTWLHRWEFSSARVVTPSALSTEPSHNRVSPRVRRKIGTSQRAGNRRTGEHPREFGSSILSHECLRHWQARWRYEPSPSC